MLVGLDHVQLAMPEGGEARARQFYGDLLGLAEREKPGELKQHGGCWFENGALKVHLGVARDFHPARKAHPAFICNAFAQLRGRLAANGTELTEVGEVEGRNRFFCFDPFGNRIEIVEGGEV